MTARAFGGDVRIHDADGEVGIDRRYASLSDRVANNHTLPAGNEDADVGVRLEAGARAADLDPVALAVSNVSPAFVTPGSVVAHVDGRVIESTDSPIDEASRGIDHSQCLTIADGALLDAQLTGVGTTACDLDDDVGSVAGFDAQLAGEVVDRDNVA